MATITLKGNSVHTSGSLPAVGSKSPDFKLVRNDLSEVSLSNYQGKHKILNIFPSVDTGTCATSVRKFNQEAASLSNAVVLNISAAGTVINMQSVMLSLMDNNGSMLRLSPEHTLIRSDESFPMGGRVQTLAFTWRFSPNMIPATRWQIDFSSTGANTSLDAVSLDMRFIPAPGALSVLAMLGGGGMICGRRRRL